MMLFQWMSQRTTKTDYDDESKRFGKTTSFFQQPMECPSTQMLLIIAMCISTLAVIYRSRQGRPPELTVKTALGNVTYNELDECVFHRSNFKLRAALHPLPLLDFIRKQTCEQIFADWLRIAASSSKFGIAPKTMPIKLKKKFLMYGYSVLIELYRDQHAVESPKDWTQIPEWMKLEEDQLRSIVAYRDQSMAVVHALKEYPPKNKRGLVIGSEKPWVEVLALRAGAEEITTVEYQKLTIHGTDRVKYIHPMELAQMWREYEGKFDFAIAFSSIEHSGLGR
ncbi:hypothetical protein Y032_0155g3030 [Ancylostoma ceylanicum]|uniref:Uncharacterized protein n=5 Tax=Ancylostoma ceylanicum TaxID=53326 RepID=A0A016SZI9_9BILA|nr:hypothetical protein Y032_0155g3030 [Ancylostoma ceylanicum]